MDQLASKNAPTPWLIIPHFISGGISLLVVTVLITFLPNALTQHYFNSHLLAITHLLVLGWISMVIFGALYQLIPVIMETRLFSEKLAFSSYFLFVLGTILLVISFWNFWLTETIYIAASSIIIAVVFFVINVTVTANTSNKKSIEKRFILTSTIWLLFTVLIGILLAINLTHTFIPVSHLQLLTIHAHSGFVGWFILLIIGVSSRLLPMFMVSHNLTISKLTKAYYLINIGLIAAIISLYFGTTPGVIVSSSTVVIGLFFYLSFLLEAYKKRIKKGLDIGMKQSAISFVIMLIPIILIQLITLSSNLFNKVNIPSVIVYGSVLLFGFVSSLILGQTYKTLPFIIWLKVYKSKIGKQKIPFPKDLYSETIAKIQLVGFTLGIMLLLLGIMLQQTYVISLSGIIMFIAVLLYNINVLKIIFHQPIKPQNE